MYSEYGFDMAETWPDHLLDQFRFSDWVFTTYSKVSGCKSGKDLRFDS